MSQRNWEDMDHEIGLGYGFPRIECESTGIPQYSMMGSKSTEPPPNSVFDELPWQIEDDLPEKPPVILETTLFGRPMIGKSKAMTELTKEIYRRGNMPKQYEEVTRIPVNLRRTENYKVELVRALGSKTGYVSVKREVKERDITDDCVAKLVKSSTVDAGYYIKLFYKGLPIAIVGVWDSNEDHILTNGYRIERPDEAWYSFRVIKER